MKRIKVLAAIAIITVLTFTGCAKISEKQKIQKKTNTERMH